MNLLATIGYPLLGVAALNLSLAAFLVAGRRKDPLRPYAAAMAFFNAIYALVIGVAYVRASMGLGYAIFYRAAWVGWLALAPLTQMCFIIQRRPRRAFWSGVVLYVVWGAILALCLGTDLVEVGAVSLVPFVDAVGPYEQLSRALGAVCLTNALVEMYRAHRASKGRRRQQTGYLLLGMAIYGVAGLFFAGVFQIVGPVRFDPGLVAYFAIAWMALTFYSIHRHRLFDIRFVISRSIEAVLLGGMLATMIIAVFRLLAHDLGVSAAVTTTAIVSACAIFMTPLVGVVQQLTDRLLLRHRYDYSQALRESAQALAARVRVDEVCQQLLAVTRDTVGISCGALLLPAPSSSEGGFVVAHAYGVAPAAGRLADDAALTSWLGDHARLFVRDEQDGEIAEDKLHAMDEELGRFGAEVAIAIRHQQAIGGILLLGGKLDRDAYLQTDVDLLETLATEAGIALTNARLLEEREASIHLRDDFLAIAGHELRTPLTALTLNVQSLLSPPPADERVFTRLAKTERQIARLTRLTNELLDVSRITAGQLRLERELVDLAAVGHDVVSRFSEEIRRTGSTCELVAPGAVPGSWDRIRVEQILTNLVSNAIKYGQGNPIRVQIEGVEGHARIVVEDQGIGIGEADHQRIFERFERAVSQRHLGGFGLGLWITKQFVEAHGGLITVASTPNEGTRFVVELPTAIAKA